MGIFSLAVDSFREAATRRIDGISPPSSLFKKRKPFVSMGGMA
jgi:hypothetical protein